MKNLYIFILSASIAGSFTSSQAIIEEEYREPVVGNTPRIQPTTERASQAQAAELALKRSSTSSDQKKSLFQRIFGRSNSSTSIKETAPDEFSSGDNPLFKPTPPKIDGKLTNLGFSEENNSSIDIKETAPDKFSSGENPLFKPTALPRITEEKSPLFYPKTDSGFAEENNSSSSSPNKITKKAPAINGTSLGLKAKASIAKKIAEKKAKTAESKSGKSKEKPVFVDARILSEKNSIDEQSAFGRGIIFSSKSLTQEVRTITRNIIRILTTSSTKNPSELAYKALGLDPIDPETLKNMPEETIKAHLDYANKAVNSIIGSLRFADTYKDLATPEGLEILQSKTRKRYSDTPADLATLNDLLARLSLPQITEKNFSEFYTLKTTDTQATSPLLQITTLVVEMSSIALKPLHDRLTEISQKKPKVPSSNVFSTNNNSSPLKGFQPQ